MWPGKEKARSQRTAAGARESATERGGRGDGLDTDEETVAGPEVHPSSPPSAPQQTAPFFHFPPPSPPRAVTLEISWPRQAQGEGRATSPRHAKQKKQGKENNKARAWKL